jgi:proline-specific peptidase
MSTTAQERHVPVPGGRVWTVTHRSGRPATPLVVLHGGPGMPSPYLSGLAALAADRDVVLYDQLGCGRSERPADPGLWTVPRAVAEVEAVRTALGVQRMHLLGHSWGGFLAVAYASQHPDRVASAVLSSPLISVAGWLEDAAALLEQLPEASRLAIARHEAAGTFEHPEYQAATAEFYRRFFCALDPWPVELERTFREMGEGPYRTLWGPSEFTQTGTLRGADLTPELPRLRRPTLWICGDHDEVDPARLRRFAGASGGRVEVFEGGTHCVHLEQPHRYVRVVGGFLAEVE